MQTQQKDRLIDVPEICAQLGIGKSTVYELFASGKLKCWCAFKITQPCALNFTQAL